MPLPDLPEIIARLVQDGVYSVYKVDQDTQAPFILVTDGGAVHPLSPTGGILASGPQKPLADYQISDVVRLVDGLSTGPSIKINNS